MRQLTRFKRRYPTRGLEEDKVLKAATLLLNLRRALRKNVLDIFNYVFTEIVNNAIEHSGAKACEVEVLLDQFDCSFTVRDRGIGIFHSIFSKLRLPDEASAIGELVKGKITTMRERHSGEGIFFSSKAADTMSFRSHGMSLLFDNTRRDIFVEQKRHIEGTEVKFRIGRFSRRDISGVFKTYAPEEYDYRFERTGVAVKLFHKDYVSRSEARRLLAGLDRFSEVILDFKGVNSIGQGFADEIFRVFKMEHPEIAIRFENTVPAIAAMIRHVVDVVID